MSALRRARRSRRPSRAGKARRVVVRELYLLGLREHVVEVDRLGREVAGAIAAGPTVRPDGDRLACTQIILVGEAASVAAIERVIRSAAATRWVVVQPTRNAEEALRAQRIAARLLGEEGASA